MSCELVINRCSCGWQFYAFSKWETRCPQCRDIINRCACCGDDITMRYSSARYCHKCEALNKKIYNKYYMQSKRRNIRETIGDICNYDCANCQFSDCILPVDPDDKQEELF